MLIQSKKYNLRNYLLIVTLILTLTMLVSGTVLADDEDKLAIGADEMVAAAHPLAAEAGMEMLEQGGNAVDAAAAIGFSLGVVEPFASGLGGEGVMVLYLAEEEEVLAIDFKGVAPSLVPEPEDWDTETVTDDEHWRMGPSGSYVPGTPAGLAYALEEYGTMELDEVLAPAIRQAEEGYEVYGLLADLIADRNEHANEAWKDKFMPDGFAPIPGDTITMENKANTLRTMAEEGVEAFYEGEIAEKIADSLGEDNGGFFTLQDLKDYEPIERDPAAGQYRGYDVFSSPPPVTGPIMIKALNILDHYNVEKLYETDKALYKHIFMETFDIAMADYYNALIDPDFGETPLDQITDPKYALERSLMIGETTKEPFYESWFEPVDLIDWDVVEERRAATSDANSLNKNQLASLTEEPGDGSTTHYVVHDNEGNVVSTTQTISFFMGSRYVVPETGILMNNGIGLFSDNPEDIDRIDPGKRAPSNLTPTIVLDDGAPYMAIGSPGATRIMPAIAQVMINVIDFDKTLKAAIESPRMHYQGQIEDPSEDIIAGLEELGHEITSYNFPDEYFGGVQALLVEEGIIFGGADPRRAGVAIGR